MSRSQLIINLSGALRACLRWAVILVTPTFWEPALNASCSMAGGILFAPMTGAHYGVSLKTTLDEVDVGFYALRYASEYPFLRFNFYAPPPTDPEAGEFFTAYPGGIDLYGASISGYVGNSTISGEIVTRRNTPLLGGSAVQQYVPFDIGTTVTANYARGDTLHTQVSLLSTFAPDTFWDSANLNMQLGSTWVLDVTRNIRALDLSRERFVASLRVLFEPHYFQVMPNLDISFPLGFGYGLAGQSNLYFGPVYGAGDLEIGISATYRSLWKADLTFTAFVGEPYRQVFADRNFILLSVERTF
jgi:hypothetical protein